MRWILLAAVALACWVGRGTAARAAGPAKRPRPIPVILDTDIGDDIDDTWALVMLLKSPQLDVKLITTTSGKAENRAKILARMLTLAGRTDVAIGVGAGGRGGTHRQQEWVKDVKLSDYAGKVHADGVQAMIDTIRASREPMTVIAIGPLHTVSAALQRDPKIAPKAAFVGMHGSVRKGYGGSSKPSAEWNVRANAAAAKRVLSAPWRRIEITPLDTCGLVQLSGKRFLTVRDSADPLAAALMENYRIWAKKPRKDQLTASSTLFDTVAVYLAWPGPKRLVKRESLSIAVTDKGFTVIDPAGTKMTVATEWKSLDGYYDLLVETLTAPLPARKR
jgi:inosine-uridine nucleoside N-ribohydrolase